MSVSLQLVISAQDEAEIDRILAVLGEADDGDGGNATNSTSGASGSTVFADSLVAEVALQLEDQDVGTVGAVVAAEGEEVAQFEVNYAENHSWERAF